MSAATVHNPRHDELTDITIAYCNKWPSAGDRTLARMIRNDYAEHPIVKGLTQDALIYRVRFRRGHSGNKHRQHSVIIESKFRDAASNPLALPDAYADPYQPVALPLGRGVILSDVHLPYHVQSSLTVAIRYAIDKGYDDYVILNGDVMDFYQVSDFSHNPEKAHFKTERDAWFWFADVLRDGFGDARIYYKLGNHDLRLEHYLWTHAQELYGLDETSFESVMRLQEYGITSVGASSPLQHRQLSILHGHEFGGGANAPVNPARTAYLRTGECAIVGHYHRTSEHTEVHPLSDHIVTCWSVGTLADLHPSYRPLNGWNHGFCCLETTKDGFSVENKRIRKGRVL